LSEMSEIVFKNKIFQTRAKLIKNIEVAPKYYKILLSCPEVAKAAKPGQFVNIKVSNDFEPLLRRPLGIHKAAGQNIEVLFEAVGKGTEILSQRKSGEFLDIIGPLGNGFNYTLYAICYMLPVLVAGGMGIAPLLFLAQKLAQDKPIVLLGARTKKQILCEKEFKDLGCEVKIATDDGSAGFKGKVTELLKAILVTGHRSQVTGKKLATCDLRLATMIYACGPRPMLKEIANISKKYNIPAQISLEEHMACGIGACLGCVVNTTDGYKQVCKDGPVFDAKKIIWE
jgi:dihydroorotate dehydrogenase electron transfer subunit